MNTWRACGFPGPQKTSLRLGVGNMEKSGLGTLWDGSLEPQHLPEPNVKCRFPILRHPSKILEGVGMAFLQQSTSACPHPAFVGTQNTWRVWAPPMGFSLQSSRYSTLESYISEPFQWSRMCYYWVFACWDGPPFPNLIEGEHWRIWKTENMKLI